APHDKKFEGRKMNARTLVLATSLAASLVAAGCATQQAPQPEAPAPAPAPAPEPAPRAVEAPKPMAAKPAVVNLSATQLFDFNKATLRPDAREVLDREVLPKLQGLKDVRYINVNGHADRLGSAQYDQRLSEKRAEAVRAYLVSKGAGAGKIETFGFGKTLPVKSCPDQKDRKSLIECLAPNRRVVVEIQGTPK
ncbi:MAG TPA: OmpA family protein, partial [Burkholderiales bacterium]|nr:OmpA family protein [Burkholderiales bacterium]